MRAVLTVRARACSATQGEDVGAADQASTGGRCTAASIRNPREGTDAPYAFEEGFCFGLARYELESPNRAGSTTGFFDFIYDHCRMYSSSLQPAVAAKVHACLKEADDKRPRRALGGGLDPIPTQEFDSMVMYECGKDALWSICNDGIDGRVNAQKDADGRGRCDRIAASLNSQGDGRRTATVVGECNRVLSGLKSSARRQMEECVTNDGFDLYTCAEGLVEDYRSEPGEPTATCTPANAPAAPPTEADCSAVLTKAAGEGEWYVPEFAAHRCEVYRTKLQPAAAKLAIQCLLDPENEVYDNIYTCGVVALKDTCREPEAIDPICKTLVATVTAVDPQANKGGRLTRQCRTLLPGLKGETLAEIGNCVPSLARSFGPGMAQYALYSCVEGL